MPSKLLLTDLQAKRSVMVDLIWIFTFPWSNDHRGGILSLASQFQNVVFGLTPKSKTSLVLIWKGFHIHRANIFFPIQLHLNWDQHAKHLPSRLSISRRKSPSVPSYATNKESCHAHDHEFSHRDISNISFVRMLTQQNIRVTYVVWGMRTVSFRQHS